MHPRIETEPAELSRVEKLFLYIIAAHRSQLIAFLKAAHLPDHLLKLHRAGIATGGTADFLAEHMAELMVVGTEKDVDPPPAFEFPLGGR